VLHLPFGAVYGGKTAQKVFGDESVCKLAARDL
jgi:hypothetical protein